MWDVNKDKNSDDNVYQYATIAGEMIIWKLHDTDSDHVWKVLKTLSGVFGLDGEKYAKYVEDSIQFRTYGQVVSFLFEAIQSYVADVRKSWPVLMVCGGFLPLFLSLLWLLMVRHFVDMDYLAHTITSTEHVKLSSLDFTVGNKMHKAFPLPGESSHWQYKFPLPVEGVPTARRMEIPLPGVYTAMMKKLPVKENWQLH
nr:choline transporter-like protein 2 [Tanacetum cinerariifolium]